MIDSEPSDAVFEKQFDYVNFSITTFTPRKYREDLSEQVFNHILKMITENKERPNRIIVLKQKLVRFAQSDKTKETLLKWKNKELEALKEHEPTLGQQWSFIIKAFTLPSLTV